MDSKGSGHGLHVSPFSSSLSGLAPDAAGLEAGAHVSLPMPPALAAEPAAAPLDFDAVYEEYVDFVWRSLRSLGVREATVEDAVQDVFVVVHRKLAEFEQRSTLRTWIFGVALRVAHDHRRREGRKGGLSPLDFEIVDRSPAPDEQAVHNEALREVAGILEALDTDKRAIFILAELEQWTAPEIASALGLNLNTVYSRIRAARREFDAEQARREEGDAR